MFECTLLLYEYVNSLRNNNLFVNTRVRICNFDMVLFI